MKKIFSIIILGFISSTSVNAAVIALHAQANPQQNCNGEILSISILGSEGVMIHTSASSKYGCTILFTKNDRATGAALSQAIGKQLKIESYTEGTQEVTLSIAE